MRAVSLLLPLLFAPPAVMAQEPPATTEEAPTPPAAPAASTQEAIDAWERAWKAIPQLVSIQSEHEDVEAHEALRKRLKLLGEKTFSNREWKSYWATQGQTATAVADALEAEGLDPEGAKAFRAWAALATDKVANQDVFFDAIAMERDALEDRLESVIESKPVPAEPELPASDPNAYERRRQRLAELERRLNAQELKRAQVSAEVTFIQRQLESEAILAKALNKDLKLAEREHELALAEATRAGGHTKLWGTIADKAQAKVEKLSADFAYGESRARGRQVELGLAKSQIAFRDARITELKTELEQAGSLGSWFHATGETVLGWIQEKAWRIFIGLVAIYIGARFSLRLVSKLAVIILERTDDNPDVDDDNDQRRNTLADVFTSVARIAIYIVAGLIALEQIGINTGPLLGSVAILGLAISFGSQNLVRDVVNGFFILLENQFAVGDVVTINGQTGGVEKITIRSTWIRSASGDLHVLPNGAIGLVSNLTRGWSKATVEIGVSYAADLDHVREVINREGAKMYADPEWTENLQEAPTWIGVTALGDSSVVVRTQAKVIAGQQWAVTRELNRRLKIAFDAEGIEIPFPQSVVHHVQS